MKKKGSQTADRIARRLGAGVVLSILLVLAPTPTHAASSFVIVDLDAAGEGLQDAAPFPPVGGNDALTLGAARLRAVEFAASMWANSLDSPVPIRIGVQFDPLGGSATAAPLGFGGTSGDSKDFPGAPLPSVWYPSALADKLAGEDLAGPSTVDVDLVFNSDVDGSAVLGTAGFYYGFDSNVPTGDVDFLSVALHELAHGLGFTTSVDLATGEKFLGVDDVFLLNLEHHGALPPDLASMTDAQRLAAFSAGSSLHWTGTAAVARGAGLSAGVGAGGHLEMHAPDPPVEVFSLIHFAVAVEPDDLMEPTYLGAPLDLGLALALFEDLGWGPAPTCSTVVLP